MAGIMPAPVAAARAPRGPYEVIAADLREQIVTGQLRAGDQLPTVAELATRHGVAVGTVHRAIDLLRSDGLVDTSRGRRSVVVFPAR
jgi:DNA-binding GntR family transcriptional regulator